MNLCKVPLIQRCKVLCKTKRSPVSVFYNLFASHASTVLDEEAKANVAPQNSRRIYVWGQAEHGALGYTTQAGEKKRKQIKKDYFTSPVRLHFGHHYKITDIACGYGFTLVATKNKDKNLKLFGCGLNSDSQIGYHDPRKQGSPLEMILSLVRIQLPFKHTTTDIIRIAAGRAHTVIVTDNEGAFTFGNNSFGQCGRGIVEGEEYHRKWFCHNIPHLDKEKVVDAVCGMDHTLFLTESGRVFSCGWGADGQTGLGHFNNEATPSLVRGDIEGQNIIKLSCAVDCVLAVNDQGDVFGWGNTEYGQISKTEMQLGSPRVLTQCKGVSPIVDVASGGSACLMLNEEGQVYSWGYGMLGRGPKVSRSMIPGLIPATLFGRDQFNPESRVTSLLAGVSTFGALTNSGQLYMWGKNQFGQLGLGTLRDQHFPLKVAVGADIQKVCCGVDHTVALSKYFMS